MKVSSEKTPARFFGLKDRPRYRISVNEAACGSSSLRRALRHSRVRMVSPAAFEPVRPHGYLLAERFLPS